MSDLLDSIIDNLLAQQEERQELKKKVCKDRLRFIIRTYGYDMAVRMLDEVQAEEFAKGEIETYKSNLQWEIL